MRNLPRAVTVTPVPPGFLAACFIGALMVLPAPSLTVKLAQSITGPKPVGIVIPQNVTVKKATPTVAPHPRSSQIEQFSKRVSSYLQQDWELSAPEATEVATAVAISAKTYQVSPFVLLAIAATETRFQHDKVTARQPDPKRPYGIMQVNGRFHAQKFPGGRITRTGVRTNVALGAQIYREYLDAEGSESKAILRYNASKAKVKYLHKVEKYKQLFEAKLGRGFRRLA